MKVQFNFPVERYSGHDGSPSGLVYFQSNGVNVARKFVTPTDPNTAQQVLARSGMTAAAQAFKALTPAQRATWTAWAQTDTREILGKTITLQDMSLYVSLDTMKYLKDGTHLTDAPTALPGFSASAIDSVAYASATTTISFDVTHNGTAADGYWIVKLTGAMASAQRMARPTDYRLAEGYSASSIVPVEATPQTISLTSPVFSWIDGDYMHIELTPVGADWSQGTPFDSRQQISAT